MFFLQTSIVNKIWARNTSFLFKSKLFSVFTHSRKKKTKSLFISDVTRISSFYTIYICCYYIYLFLYICIQLNSFFPPPAFLKICMHNILYKQNAIVLKNKKYSLRHNCLIDKPCDKYCLLYHNSFYLTFSCNPSMQVSASFSVKN